MSKECQGQSLRGVFSALLAAVWVFFTLPVAAANDKVPSWSALTPSQQQALAPLQRDWPSLEPNRRQKWLEVAARFPAMPLDERRRVQERMAEWARLTPAERTEARLRFQEVRQLPAEERHAKWQAYQALPEEERKTLAQRAVPPAKGASPLEQPAKARVTADTPVARRVPGAASAASAAISRPSAPIVVQARPGATTTTMSARNVPRAKPQEGAPKIAATSSYVNPATLLPKRTPQGAAVPTSPLENAEQP